MEPRITFAPTDPGSSNQPRDYAHGAERDYERERYRHDRHSYSEIKLVIGPGTLVIPSWIGAALVLAFLFSAFSLLLLWNSNRTTEREIRVLQLHVADVQNVMIREGKASRSDFGSWGENGPPNAPDKLNTQPQPEVQPKENKP
jgi:hypothetical protein